MYLDSSCFHLSGPNEQPNSNLLGRAKKKIRSFASGGRKKIGSGGRILFLFFIFYFFLHSQKIIPSNAIDLLEYITITFVLNNVIMPANHMYSCTKLHSITESNVINRQTWQANTMRWPKLWPMECRKWAEIFATLCLYYLSYKS